MRLRTLFLTAAMAATAAMAQTATAPPQVTVKLSVVDSGGKAVEGAQASMVWTMDAGGKIVPMPSHNVASDSRGAIEMPLTLRGFPATLTVYNQARTEAAIVRIADESAAKSATLVKLAPVAKVLVSAKGEDGSPVEGVNFNIRNQTAAANVLSLPQLRDFAVPEGEYTIGGFGLNYNQVNQAFTARAGETVDLGTVVLSQPPFAKNAGKPAMPLSFAEARGLPSDFQLTDLKGKWVLLEFWGFW